MYWSIDESQTLSSNNNFRLTANIASQNPSTTPSGSLWAVPSSKRGTSRSCARSRSAGRPNSRPRRRPWRERERKRLIRKWRPFRDQHYKTFFAKLARCCCKLWLALMCLMPLRLHLRRNRLISPSGKWSGDNLLRCKLSKYLKLCINIKL